MGLAGGVSFNRPAPHAAVVLLCRSSASAARQKPQDASLLERRSAPVAVHGWPHVGGRFTPRARLCPLLRSRCRVYRV